MKYLVDKAEIKIEAGNGGDGLVSFRREKYIPKGGPDGGDGGNGGSVYFVGALNMATLMDFRSKAKYKADDGEHGKRKKMKGKNGDDLYIKVPLGTLIYEQTDGGLILIGDIVNEGDVVLAARGGKGGLGNVHFKNSVNQAPLKATKGTKSEKKNMVLEIKLVADIGLVGLPNAGKSTLINSMTGSKVKIANYPFTTLVPNLGPLHLRSGETVIMADIPGLIGGASKGKGLGDEFLRHVERTRILVHIIDPIADELFDADEKVSEVRENSTTKILVENALKSYETIRDELKDYGAGLENKPEIVAINKIDITEIRDAFEEIKVAFEQSGIKVLGISAFTGEGLEVLEKEIIRVLEQAPKRVTFESDKLPIKIFTLENLPNRRIVQN